ncbi:hypothetical protein HDR58_01825, partial [bacterium]|nr:hypothetical protein [bacterium]
MRNDIFVPSKATFKVSFGGGVTLKALSAAVLASCFSFGAQQTFAADISNVDLTKQPLSSPTLDYLNKQGVEFKDESGNVLKDYSSSYTLTKVNSPSDNTITKYEINRATGEITGEQSYKVDFKSATSVDDYVDKYTDVVSGNNSNTPLFENPTGIVADSINQRVYKNNTSSTKVSSNSDFGTYAQIVNNGDISDINADFVGNTASVNSSSSTAWRYFYGNASGAIYNNGNINNISGDFIGNSFSSSRVYLWGAKTASAILNDYNGEISNIKGNFVDNYGGAINNAGTIGNILGSFVNNDSGAIYNSGKISNIVGDFYRSSIENSGEISNIVGDFINSANNYNYGAITNYNNDNDDTGYIGNIVGNFFNNAYGAILNYSVINNVTGYFAGNGYYSYNGGGAIKNSGYINVTNSTFVENTSENNGGAIYSGFNESIYSGSIPEGKSAVKATETFNTNVKSSIFTNNKVSYGSGGAIALSYNIDFYSGERPIPVSLDSDISNNTDNSSIINKFKESISVNIEDSIFNENMAQYAGGAIAAYGRITEYQDSYSYGPSSLNIETASSSDNVSVLNIKNSKFINNIVEDWYEPKYTLASYATYEAYGNDTFSAQYGGGAIWTNVATKIENSLFDGNKTINGNGGAIFADVEDYQIYNNGWGPAEENLSDTSGIALMSEGVSPQTNYVVYENGATPTQSNGLTIKNSSFINNTASSDLEVQTPEAWDYINYLENFGDYETANNLYDLLDAEAEKRGYDIENGNYPPADIQDEIINKIVGSTQEFKDFVKMAEEAQKAHGGAIYSAQNTQIIADNADVIFKNNKVVNNGKETLNDIYMLTSIGNKQSAMAGNIVATANDEIRDLVTLTLDARNGGSIVLNGTIDGGIVTYPQRNTSMDQSVLNADTNISNDSKTDFQPAYNLNITGDGTGNVVFGNSVKNASITTFNGSNASLTKDSNWNNNILTMQGGQISMINNEVGTMNLQRMLVTKDTNLLVDVDLAKNTMDTIKSKDYSEHFGNVNVSGMNLLSDAKNEKTEIYFAEQGLKDNVTNGTGELPDQNQTAYTPIYKYNVSYDNREDGGYFVFNRGGSAGNPSDSFNPSILATPVSSVAASQATINETFKYVFEHADAFTQLPQSIRLSRLNANKYALNETNPYGLGSSTDFDGNRGSLCY